jgi:SAM-dependent methyltransferase
VNAPGAGEAGAVYPQDVSGLYELFYTGRGKDFAREAETIAGLVRERRPGAGSLLDVACGPGVHAAEFCRGFAEVACLDASASMCALAKARAPRAVVHQGDMRAFRLERKFDAVTCLTSSVGYMAEGEELRRAVAAMAAHLEPGGVLVIDPWWTPEQYLEGYVSADSVKVADLAVARVSQSARTGRTVRNEARYLIARASGIAEVTHVQPLTLHSRQEYLDAIEAAGCAAEHVADLAAFPDRGLFLGLRTLRDH